MDTSSYLMKSTWDNITLSAEFKKANRDNDVDANVGGVSWSMRHVMRSDPCRRFAFGTMVEDTDTGASFCSRQLVLA
ncbi:hypothetical protein SCP_0302950 [Sparassis crispa]|uniref:Fungal-type protein kinase domain-containing protein n=1 Tax=Sparassis crispa TaxID=139825 RepID=A0A401GEI2_9APHY|nr:hypothetical protein SCP_0302950 [Sparassis crispa]GBE80580.1 hypothetical protein SCP_0302950 [Sparassis crispa]